MELRYELILAVAPPWFWERIMKEELIMDYLWSYNLGSSGGWVGSSARPPPSVQSAPGSIPSRGGGRNSIPIMIAPVLH